jgi:hypothetical protein
MSSGEHNLPARGGYPTRLPPLTAPLIHSAIPDPTLARLHFPDGRSVNADRWRFLESVTGSGDFDLIEIDSSTFNPSSTYLLDYQSSDVQGLKQLLCV